MLLLYLYCLLSSELRNVAAIVSDSKNKLSNMHLFLLFIMVKYRLLI